MRQTLKKIYSYFLIIITVLSIIFSLASCKSSYSKASSKTLETNSSKELKESDNISSDKKIDENGTYTGKDEVALYIYTYRKLPKNYIKKKDAEKLGWKKSKNNLYEVTGGKSIGGDKFSNYEKLLPVVKGRTYYECDIDYEGGPRNAKRIIYASDFDEEYGFIFYTGDHYKSFEKLY